MPAEIWKPTARFNGYEVSNLGRVRRVGSESVLKPSIGKGKNGYLRVFPCVDGIDRGVFVHVLLMEAFVGPCPRGKQINHKNGVKADISLSNLEYVTARDNNVHALLTGLRKPRPILTHCLRGHLKTGINSIHLKLDGTLSVRPRCKTCNSDSARRAYYAKRSAA